MAEYEDEEVVDEEAPLSAEELFELHKEEINAAFEEKGFFRRFSDMLKRLSKPKSSAEYKLARVELNRLAAPILAVVLPTIAVIVLIVVTQVTSQPQETIEVEGVEYPVVKVEISNTSHPFYTGKMKLVDTAGRVDKFYSRYGKKDQKK